MHRPLIHDRHAPPRHSFPSVRGGFTLIEIIVVVVVLAIVAAAVIPRITGTARQEASVAVDRLAELLRLYAFRQAMSTQQVALQRDGWDGRIYLFVRDLDPDAPDEPPTWRPDRFAAPVALPRGVELTEVRVHEQRQPEDEWTITSVPGGARPKVEIRVVGNGVDALLVLPAESAAVYRVDAGQPPPFARTAIDLDRAGRDLEPW